MLEFRRGTKRIFSMLLCSTVIGLVGATTPAVALAASYICVMGGAGTSADTGSKSDVWYAQVNCDGTLSSWTSTTALPYANGMDEMGAVAVGPYIFIAGGFNSTSSNTTSAAYSNVVSANGSLGSWTSDTPLPNIAYQPTLMADPAGSYVFSLGAAYGGGPASYYAYSAPQSGGTISAAWTSQTGLPISLAEQAGFRSGSYAIVGSGWTNTTPNGFYNSTISGGTLSAWAATGALPPMTYSQNTGISSTQVVSCGSYAYLTGGFEGQWYSTARSTVFSTTVSNGALGSSWTSLNSLPVILAEHSSVIAEGYLFVIGGSTAVNAVANVYSAQILSGGGLGSWASQNALPAGRTEPAAVVVSFDPQGTPISLCVACTPSATATPTFTFTNTNTFTATNTATQTPFPTWCLTRTPFNDCGGNPVVSCTPNPVTYCLSATSTVTSCWNGGYGTCTTTSTPTATATAYCWCVNFTNTPTCSGVNCNGNKPIVGGISPDICVNCCHGVIVCASNTVTSTPTQTSTVTSTPSFTPCYPPCNAPIGPFPNPARSSILFGVTGLGGEGNPEASAKEFSVRLFSIDGRLVREARSVDGWIRISVSDLPRGVYAWIVRDSEGKRTHSGVVAVVHDGAEYHESGGNRGNAPL